MTKMTKKTAFTTLRAFYADNSVDTPEVTDAILEILDKEIASLSKPKAPSAKQNANESLKDIIYNCLSDVPITVGELMKHPALIGNSNQKLTALLSAMVKDGKIDRVVEKRRAYFVRHAQ